MDTTKQKIINLFNKQVKGKKPDLSKYATKHDGKAGHWLEKQMGIKPNASNEPDIYGYEMKNQTSSGKITFGDWSADEYIFQHGRPKKTHDTNRNYNISRDDFLRIFGRPNPEKENRLSWSGEPCPSYINERNDYGQILKIDENENIIISYSYSKDNREFKDQIVPTELRKEDLVLAKWHNDSIKKKLENKFNQKGWFTCKKNKDGFYESIHFGNPMNFESWLELFKNRHILFDSGMHYGNKRNYSQWRAMRGVWDNLIVSSY